MEQYPDTKSEELQAARTKVSKPWNMLRRTERICADQLRQDEERCRENREVYREVFFAHLLQDAHSLRRGGATWRYTTFLCSYLFFFLQVHAVLSDMVYDLEVWHHECEMAELKFELQRAHKNIDELQQREKELVHDRQQVCRLWFPEGTSV